MFYVVGLGNPGATYERTRHNVGWLALDYVVQHFKWPQPVVSAAFSGRTTRGVLDRTDVTILYPDTFMNHSGSAVGKLVSKNDIERLVVLYDDIALPIGTIKISFARGDGGHNGLKSISAVLGSDAYIRVRIGIAPTHFLTGTTVVVSGQKRADYVLNDFSKREHERLHSDVFPEICTALSVLVKSGREVAMNRFN